mmetsp:Transcript_87487/g.276443  ORF Transcript_87487/g.276443 Transcript_87487/m.276443 type:complete len:209 (+) Transcript_87487:1868-2494(+)
MLLRMVHDGQAGMVLHVQVDAATQDGLHDAQVAVARRPHACTPALLVSHQETASGAHQGSSNILVAMDGGPHEGSPAVMILHIQLDLPRCQELRAPLVAAAAGQHQGRVPVRVAYADLCLCLEEKLHQLSVPCVADKVHRCPAKGAVLDVHVAVHLLYQPLDTRDVILLQALPQWRLLGGSVVHLCLRGWEAEAFAEPGIPPLQHGAC